MSLSGVVKSVQDIMRKDAGVDGDAQRIGQLAWMLFLKIFDDRDQDSNQLILVDRGPSWDAGGRNRSLGSWHSGALLRLRHRKTPVRNRGRATSRFIVATRKDNGDSRR